VEQTILFIPTSAIGHFNILVACWNHFTCTSMGWYFPQWVLSPFL